jgi:hypothetical protein
LASLSRVNFAEDERDETSRHRSESGHTCLGGNADCHFDPRVDGRAAQRERRQPAAASARTGSRSRSGINNIEALRFLAPADWKVEGGIVWHHETWLLAMLSMRLSDPKSRASITIFPADTFGWSPATAQFANTPQRRYLGSLVMRLPDNTPDTITRVLVPAFRPQLRTAKVTDTEDLPALAKIILQQNQEAGLQKSCQASRVRFAYNDQDGTPMEEDLYAVVITTPMPMLNAMSWHLDRTKRDVNGYKTFWAKMAEARMRDRRHDGLISTRTHARIISWTKWNVSGGEDTDAGNRARHKKFLRKGRPKFGKDGVKVISLSMEKQLLKRADAHAKKNGLKRAEFFSQAVRVALGKAS